LYDFLVGVCGVVLGNNGLPGALAGPGAGPGIDDIFLDKLTPFFNDVFFFDLICFVIYFVDIKYMTNFF
jgi:hypothetical protein